MHPLQHSTSFPSAHGGTTIDRSDGAIRAISDGGKVMGTATSAPLVKVLQSIEEAVFPTDSQAIRLSMDAMTRAGGRWTMVKTAAWWRNAFAEHVDRFRSDYVGALASRDAWQSAFTAYASSFDYVQSTCDAYPTDSELEALRLELQLPF